MAKLTLGDANTTRRALTKAQEKKIQSLYAQVAKEAMSKAKKLSTKQNISSKLSEQYLRKMASDLKNSIKDLAPEIETVIKDSMTLTAEAVIAANQVYIDTLGLSIQNAYSHVPTQVVNNLVSGSLYQGSWSLNKGIWAGIDKNLADINYIVAKGITAQKSSYDIAKDLEKYVNPAKAKNWEWSKVYPGSAKTVDYNAQRLARTMVSHAYQQSFVQSTINNPFITGYKWISGHSSRTCELCLSRSEDNSYGLGDGVFPKDQLPLDHPNGLCTYGTVQVPDGDVNSRLAAWVKSGNDKEIDSFVKSMEDK